jgi:hypothetical protein
VFGANLLAASAPTVPEDRLANHLLRAAELFLAGNDPARASLIVDYATVRVPRPRLAGPRWATVRTDIKRWRDEDSGTVETLSDREELITAAQADLARALGTLVRSRTEDATP